MRWRASSHPIQRSLHNEPPVRRPEGGHGEEGHLPRVAPSGIDETTANQLADAGIKIEITKRIGASTLVENYGLTSEIADGVIEIIGAVLEVMVESGS